MPREAPVMDARTRVPEAQPVVFIVDGDVSTREELEPPIRRAGWLPRAFGTAEGFLAHGGSKGPGCLVLDLALAGAGGLELQQRIAADRPELPIIIVSASCDVATSVRAMKAGAVDFFTKPCHEVPLLAAIASAIERSREDLEREDGLTLLRQRYATLTAREREVLALVTAGLLNKQVGWELGISEITVKAYRGSMRRKMQAGSIAHLVEIAARLGLRTWVAGAVSALGRPRVSRMG
jgi:FixJ family two-component response regulator